MVAVENDSKEFINIKGAYLHNLNHISLKIPKNKLIVITGVSGSGKSTLAFDTIYAEGQRRYVESLSSYARQFLGKIEKPQVEEIKGLSPAIAIQQKVISSNPRSTVGTSTEIYDYLRLLYARIGDTHSPISGEIVKKDDVSDVIDYIKTFSTEDKFTILSPLEEWKEIGFEAQLTKLKTLGFVRLEIEGNMTTIEDLESFNYSPTDDTSIFLVIDRSSLEEDEAYFHRLADSIQTGFYEGKGKIIIKNLNQQKQREFSHLFELDGITFLEPNPHFFSFNNPYGACPTCEGYGKIIGIDEDLVIPNKKLSLYDDTVVAWNGAKMQKWKDNFIKASLQFDFPIHKPYYELSEEQKEQLWNGTKQVKGIHDFFKMVEEKSYKIQYRVMLSRYRGKTKCTDCNGKRLREETQLVKINNKSLMDLIELPIDTLLKHIKSLNLNKFKQKIAKRLLIEIIQRLEFLSNVGLDYLTLNRASNSLSGGESQRINLATSLGSSLVGSIYILDEPSIGLHSRDTEKLIVILKKLRDLGNTVIVVEHDEDIMKEADYIVDIGPEAGSLGGDIVFEGVFNDLIKNESLTAKYLTGRESISIPKNTNTPNDFLDLKGIRHHNLKNINVQFPLNCFTVITGVSGSGKSTLMKDVFVPALQKEIGLHGKKIGEYDTLEGPTNYIHQIEMVDQNPIGKSSRSNPATYVKAYDDIRTLYANQKLSKLNDFKAKHFSFNVDGGRCDKCKGDGIITVEMQFMADIELTCEVCNGKRFKKEILDIKFENTNIHDLLEMTIDDALAFFKSHNQNKIYQKLLSLQDVGLGYLKMGQSSNTLSGGEAQRIKLASFLSKGINSEKTLFVFDEPSTGLHFHDIKKLLKSFYTLIQNGHTVIVIEHHLDIIKCADWMIELGPDAGINGGEVIFNGKPKECISIESSPTGKFLKEKFML